MTKNKDKENQLKIALVSYSLSSGGLERAAANASFMYQEMGYEVHLHVLEHDIKYPYAGQLFLYEIKNQLFSKKIKQYLLLKRNLKKNNYDLIIDHRYRINPWLEFCWQRYIYKKLKVINYIHSSRIINYLSTLNKIALKYIFGDRIFISVSKGIESITKKKFPFLTVKTIYNNVTIIADTEQKLKISFPYIVTISRMDKSNVKQIDVLLECFAKSKLPQNNFKLIIIGSGERQSEMENLAKQLDIAGQVLFTSFLDNPYQYLENAFFTVLTSKYEGLPTILIESLMFGIPAVSFDCETGPNEIIIDEENGLLVDNQNKEAFIEAMNRMITEPKMYAKLKSNAKKSVEKFSAHQIKSEWKQFFEKEIISDKY